MVALTSLSPFQWIEWVQNGGWRVKGEMWRTSCPFDALFLSPFITTFPHLFKEFFHAARNVYDLDKHILVHYFKRDYAAIQWQALIMTIIDRSACMNSRCFRISPVALSFCNPQTVETVKFGRYNSKVVMNKNSDFTSFEQFSMRFPCSF